LLAGGEKGGGWPNKNAKLLEEPLVKSSIGKAGYGKNQPGNN